MYMVSIFFIFVTSINFCEMSLLKMVWFRCILMSFSTEVGVMVAKVVFSPQFDDSIILDVDPILRRLDVVVLLPQ